MAVSAAPRIQASLLAVGMPADTPVTIVENGCSIASRTVHATLAGLARSIQDNKISNPAMLFVRYAMSGGDQAAGREVLEPAMCSPRIAVQLKV
jgi:siroheme synthase